MKPADILISLACDACHKEVDLRRNDDNRLAWYEGHCATLLLAMRDGMITLEGTQ